MRWTWMTVLVLLTGCDGIDLRKLVTQHDARTRVDAESAGEHCPLGGRAFLAGLDLNDNGALDDAEVTSTEYVCTTPTPGVLVHMQAVAPGEQCPHGGHVSRAGQDTNGNDVLEDGEVTREVYGCADPAPGGVLHRTQHQPPGGHIPPWLCSWGRTWVEAGTDTNGNGLLDDDEVRAMEHVCIEPARLVVAQAPERAGTTCPKGGTRVQAGVDEDGNGSLEGLEVHGTLYVCEALLTLHGDYTVRSASDLAALQHVSRIQGSLRIDDASITELSLPALSVVDHTLRLWNNQLLTRVDLPALRFVGDDFDVSANPALSTLLAGGANHLRLLVGRGVVVSNNDQLRSLSGLLSVSPRVNLLLTDNDALEFHPGEESPLVSVDNLMGSLIVQGNAALQALPLSNLFHVGGDVSIANNQALRSLSGLSPESIGESLDIIGNEALRELASLTELRHLTELRVSGNPALTTLEGLSALSSLQSLQVSDNVSLARLELTSLHQVAQAFAVTGNAGLPSCLATSLADAVYTGDAGQLAISGNDDAATCGE
ncbi:DUF7151 family protein [Corallococcus macrosporus]|uniref:DUF7151 domain-containing protein n=1 Tax=Corallococcus macrosporus DSM 14697 TaxID=1189310 RepID=A0A250K416_9BACT|nr:leucine-rich repeat domain-containing protein [Corallococcus macrosporus]ATB50718.1 hypothetical protein MYMAC_006374 [Corallococcus macrosporus DSM 14697]